MTTPRIRSVVLTRYWTMCGMRLIAVALGVWSVTRIVPTVVSSWMAMTAPAALGAPPGFGAAAVPGFGWMGWRFAVASPLGMLLVAIAFWFAAPALARATFRLPAGGCPKCGYETSAARCPECGTATDEPEREA